uniref:Uncharacterized protein n=1 Tax=Romanomermis culicivorax TaxID=13658 RepID=A0A915IUT5_ROMCU
MHFDIYTILCSTFKDEAQTTGRGRQSSFIGTLSLIDKLVYTCLFRPNRTERKQLFLPMDKHIVFAGRTDDRKLLFGLQCPLGEDYYQRMLPV